jgi:GT2 family glycosyltransferase
MRRDIIVFRERTGPELALIAAMQYRHEKKRTVVSRPETAVSWDDNSPARHGSDPSRADLPGMLRDIVISKNPDRPVEVVVCIPAFRRPEHLRVTLDSILQQRTTRNLAVVIVENDSVNRGSVPEAARFFANEATVGLCVVEPQQGNCHAINAAFETALAAFAQAHAFLMIDDDEIASSDWLELMVQAAETTGADIVGGPVFPQFTTRANGHLNRHPAFCPAYDLTGPVPLIYGSGNCLITRRVFETLEYPRFDLRFNFLGGGDTDFFTRCQDAGLRFFWNAEAEITETVPAARTAPRWLVMRGLRIGAINYHVQWRLARTLWSKALLAAKMLALPPFSLVKAVRLLMSGQNIFAVCHPIIVAAGSALASIGIEPHQYRITK